MLIRSLAIFLFLSASNAAGQPLGPSEEASLRALVERSVVKLRVRGTAVSGDTWRPQGGTSDDNYGTGVLFFNSESGIVEMLTARHVVGRDEEFQIPQGDTRPDRKIHFTISTDLGEYEVAEPLRRVLVHQSHDVARVYTGLPAETIATLSTATPVEGDTVYVFSWQSDWSRPELEAARIRRPNPAADGPNLRLDREAYSSESGSPVFDRTGKVVAILVEGVRPATSRPYSLILPVRTFASGFVPVGADDLGPPIVEASPALTVPNGNYTASRGYFNEKRPHCLANYTINAVFVSDGTITFTSDGRRWTGKINQRTGNIDIPYEGIDNPPQNPTYILGSYEDARLHNDFCGDGYFRLELQ